jgi:hypothetical protein
MTTNGRYALGILSLSSIAIFAVACSEDGKQLGSISAEPSSTSTWEMAYPPSDSRTPERKLPGLRNDLSQQEQELRVAYQDRFDGYWACLRSPEMCDESYLWPGGPAAQHMNAVRREMVARDRFVGSEDVGYYSIESVHISADQRSAEVAACWWSTAVLYGAPVRPDLPLSADNPSTFVTSTPEGGRQKDRFVRANGRWLLHATEALDGGFSQDPC